MPPLKLRVLTSTSNARVKVTGFLTTTWLIICGIEGDEFNELFNCELRLNCCLPNNEPMLPPAAAPKGPPTIPPITPSIPLKSPPKPPPLPVIELSYCRITCTVLVKPESISPILLSILFVVPSIISK